jgi:hypothetical protein
LPGGNEMMDRIAVGSPRFRARIAGIFYFLTISLGISDLYVHGNLGYAIDLIAGLSYVAVALLFYGLLKPVSKGISMLAAALGLLGFTFGRLGFQPHGVNVEMVVFGAYGLMIGYLILRSTFLPRFLGIAMALAGSAWLTYLSPSFADYLSPYNTAVGGVAQLLLCLWLLAFGVNAQRWQQQAAENAKPAAKSIAEPFPD